MKWKIANSSLKPPTRFHLNISPNIFHGYSDSTVNPHDVNVPFKVNFEEIHYPPAIQPALKSTHLPIDYPLVN